MSERPVFAAVYDAVSRAADAAGLAERRRRLLARARGRVLDVGVGTGLNLPLYADVDGVIALEPDAAMRRRLLPRLAQARVPVEVHETDLDDRSLDGEEFDTVVCTLVLCTVPDLPAALTRIRSLLRPGGQLLFLEHVRVPGGRGLVQRAATPVWKHLAGGCHLDRDTPKAIREAGFVISDLERFRTSRLDPLTAVMVQGAAQPRTRVVADQ